jgi:hypothetical protein
MDCLTPSSPRSPEDCIADLLCATLLLIQEYPAGTGSQAQLRKLEALMLETILTLGKAGSKEKGRKVPTMKDWD